MIQLCVWRCVQHPVIWCMLDADMHVRVCCFPLVVRSPAGEIEGLRERLRAMESREKEKEEEMKALKRSLRIKELSLLSGTGGLNVGQGGA